MRKQKTSKQSFGGEWKLFGSSKIELTKFGYNQFFSYLPANAT